MKRIFIALLTLSLLVSFVSCSGMESGGMMDGFINGMAPTGGAEVEWENEGIDDRYEEIIENPFYETEKQPISTFSADVDTASYTFLRKLISSGYSLEEIKTEIGPSLRTEEILNYFRYEGVQPEEGKLFGVKPIIGPCPWNPSNKLLTMTLQTATTAQKGANNLVFLIDVSGSMNSEDKLELLKEAFAMLTAALDEDDVVSIVTYSGKEEVVLEGCRGDQTEKILKAVRKLGAGGSTNGEAGLNKAYQIAEKYRIADGNNRIILASDGDLNVGISSAEDLKTLVSEKRRTGTYLSVLGFGYGNYHDASMEAIADWGNGVYYYIDSMLEAEKVFGTDLLSTLTTVAEDVKLQVTFNPANVIRYRLIGYENRVMKEEDFDNDFKDAGELGAGHSVTVCYELEMNELMPRNQDWITLDVRYKHPGESQSVEESHVISASAISETPGDDFMLCASLIMLSMVIRDSAYLPERMTPEDVNAQIQALPDRYGDDVANLKKMVETLVNRQNGGE